MTMLQDSVREIVKFSNLTVKIRKCLSPDLLKPAWRKRLKKGDKFTKGHCYVASEALYHLTGKKLQPKVLRIDKDTTHWWLENKDGVVIDPTWDQFKEIIDYKKGKNAAFLTKEPSKRCRILMERVKKCVALQWQEI